MTRVLLVAVFLAAFVAPYDAVPRAQVGAASPRRLEGRVVADDTGDVVPNARVTVAGTPPRTILADADGRFALDVAGSVRLTVGKSGYARREARIAASQPSVDVRLARAAVISGRVVDAAGDPVPNARVRAQIPGREGVALSTTAESTADDRGEYRLSGLTENDVVLSVQALSLAQRDEVIGPGIVREPSTTTVYYPGVDSAREAERIAVKPGDELRGMNFTLPPAYVTPPMPGGLVTVTVGVPPRLEPAPSRRDAVATARGRVVSAGGGAIAGARVMLTSVATRASRWTQTDAGGRFGFGELLPGEFLVQAVKTGYSGATSGFGQPLNVSTTGADVELTLTPWGSVTGRVLDELGDPVEGAAVQLLTARFEGGRRRLVPAGSPTRLTDDRGLFRIFGVPPGQYVVTASVAEITAAELPGYARSYYPGVTDAVASPLVGVGLGQTVGAIDVTLIRARTARVSGTVRDAQGRPGLVGSLTLTPARTSSVVNLPIGARVSDAGVFEFPNVLPGTYVIHTYRGQRNRSTEGEFGAVSVSVGDRDVAGLTVQAMAGSSITGRVSFVPSASGSEPMRSAIDIEPVPLDPDLSPATGRATADIAADWTFAMRGVSGPRRLAVTRTPPGWVLKEIHVGGADVTDRPLAFGTAAESVDDVEIILTDRLNQLGGRVVDRSGRPAPGANVVVFSPFRDRWYARSRYLRSTVASSDGTFTLEGLAPGTYYAAALTSVPAGGPDAWQDPVFLESISGPSSRVTLGEDDRASVSLTVLDSR